MAVLDARGTGVASQLPGNTVQIGLGAACLRGAVGVPALGMEVVCEEEQPAPGIT